MCMYVYIYKYKYLNYGIYIYIHFPTPNHCSNLLRIITYGENGEQNILLQYLHYYHYNLITTHLAVRFLDTSIMHFISFHIISYHLTSWPHVSAKTPGSLRCIQTRAGCRLILTSLQSAETFWQLNGTFFRRDFHLDVPLEVRIKGQ